MTPLLEQFLSESNEFLQSIGEKLMQLEQEPDDSDLINELFRLVHTLKGNSGLFEFPEMTRVLHAGEDLMDAVRNHRLAFSQTLADNILDAMDFVGGLCSEIASNEHNTGSASLSSDSARLAESLRARIPRETQILTASPEMAKVSMAASTWNPPLLAELPELVREAAAEKAKAGTSLFWVHYAPDEECFFKGEDPFYSARTTPDILWNHIVPRQSLPPLAELNIYRCVLDFTVLSAAPRNLLDEHFRYVIDQVHIVQIERADFGLPELAAPCAASGPISKLDPTIENMLKTQRRILSLDDSWQPGRTRAVAEVLGNCCKANGSVSVQGAIDAALADSLKASDNGPLLHWLDAFLGGSAAPQPVAKEAPKFGRRIEDAIPAAKSLKVAQAKIDRLMNLIGEMVVSKNTLPYLAQRAEDQFGVPELAREIKAQYSVINRIAEEMHDTIMQVSMLPVSFIFQRFPRLVRDISRKLGKEVQLVLEGDDTEADKNIIESLADPLMHIIRNSLDHGLETPEARRAAGKPIIGTLTIRAAQEADRVLLEIIDDGKGIDPAIIKRKAFEKGVIDQITLERISDRDALNLVFAAGFSTAEVISDLSGRGVGMDVVRTAVEKVNGAIVLESEVGKGTRIRISLPLSMALTQVMVIESDGQLFGVPMDDVVETMRIPLSAIHTIKHSRTTVLRGHIVPLKALNSLLAISAQPRCNADDELAVLVVRIGSEIVGLLVDDFQETLGIIQKPLSGILAGIPAYSGSALLGDGSVLMVLNIKEML